MNLRRGDGRPLVIGHRGASAHAPENSLEAIAAAVAAGADLVEFDVSPGLVVSHDGGGGPSLAEVLSYLAVHDIGAHVDVKAGGYEQQVLEAIDAHGLRRRVVVSTAFAAIGRRLRSLAPELPIAIGYPRDRYGVSNLRWPEPLTRAGAAALRAAMPVRVPLLLAAARADVLALHQALCSPAAVAAAHRRGAPVLAWTANEPAEIRRLAAMGVDAIVSDDPETALATLIEP
ncbi:MAG: glycerophosphodiester phosphodiesterase [Gaiellaceae bacterium]